MSILGLRSSQLITNPRFLKTVTLIKQQGGQYVDGLYVEGLEETTIQQAHWQPIDEDERLNLPETERLREALKIWVATTDKQLLRPMRQGVDNTRGDIIRIDTLDYEVLSVDNFSSNYHISAVIVRRENQSD